MADEAFVTCGLAVVHPWLCDRMGHLTTRHYMGMFDDASYQLFAMLDPEADTSESAEQGWADIRHEIAYFNELGVGALVRIEGQVTALGRTSIGTEYRMVRQSDHRLCATLAAKTVCFDLVARKAAPLPDPLRAKATALFGID